MIYRQGTDLGPLEHWPIDNPDSDYRIVHGSPQASGRLEAGGPGHVTRSGIWRCTVGAFECTEQGDEMMTLLSGHCQIEDHETGEVTHLKAGDTFFITDGSRATWTILEDVTKVFFAHKADGY